jgi:hypothetical protein
VLVTEERHNSVYYYCPSRLCDLARAGSPDFQTQIVEAARRSVINFRLVHAPVTAPRDLSLSRFGKPNPGPRVPRLAGGKIIRTLSLAARERFPRGRRKSLRVNLTRARAACARRRMSVQAIGFGATRASERVPGYVRYDTGPGRSHSPG